MAVMSIADALKAAIAEEMRRDPSVFVLGEDRSVLQELRSAEDGAPHYAVEDLLFAVYQEGTLCFLLGHSE